MRADELMSLSQNSYDELKASAFGAALLMPKTGVASAFTTRGWNLQFPEPIHIYAIACWFGVGYDTLIQQMSQTLGSTIQSYKGTAEGRVHPKELRRHILGFDIDRELVVVDLHWREKAIDVHVGDMILLPPRITNEQIGCQNHLSLVDGSETKTVFQATLPGMARLVSSDLQWQQTGNVSLQFVW